VRKVSGYHVTEDTRFVSSKIDGHHCVGPVPYVIKLVGGIKQHKIALAESSEILSLKFSTNMQDQVLGNPICSFLIVLQNRDKVSKVLNVVNVVKSKSHVPFSESMDCWPNLAERRKECAVGESLMTSLYFATLCFSAAAHAAPSAAAARLT
jgi:hypothetical protein